MRYLIAAAAYLAVVFTPTDAGAAMLPVVPPSPPSDTRVFHAACPAAPDADGCVDAAGDVYTDGDRATTAHEFGHVVDRVAFTDGDRRKLSRLLGFAPHVPWRYTGPLVDGTYPRYPNEVAADAYMTCRLRLLPSGFGRTYRGMTWTSSYDYSPRTDAAHREVCRVIDRAARRAGL